MNLRIRSTAAKKMDIQTLDEFTDQPFALMIKHASYCTREII
jgi:hypothetical protein